MKNSCTIETSQCVLCGGRLRNAVFCPVCGHSSCSTACHVRHLAQHAVNPGRPASYPGNSWRDEKPERAEGQTAVG
jgi:hypothetical protein